MYWMFSAEVASVRVVPSGFALATVWWPTVFESYVGDGCLQAVDTVQTLAVVTDGQVRARRLPCREPHGVMVSFFGKPMSSVEAAAVEPGYTCSSAGSSGRGGGGRTTAGSQGESGSSNSRALEHFSSGHLHDCTPSYSGSCHVENFSSFPLCTLIVHPQPAAFDTQPF